MIDIKNAWLWWRPGKCRMVEHGTVKWDNGYLSDFGSSWEGWSDRTPSEMKEALLSVGLYLIRRVIETFEEYCREKWVLMSSLCERCCLSEASSGKKALAVLGFGSALRSKCCERSSLALIGWNIGCHGSQIVHHLRSGKFGRSPTRAGK